MSRFTIGMFARCAALALVVVSVGWPAMSLALGLASTTVSSRANAPATVAPEVFLGTWTLFGTSLLWALLPALAATLLGWPLGIALGDRLVHGRGRALLVLSALPICIPGYLVYWSLWIGVGPGTAIGEAAMGADLVVPLRQVTLALGLIAWSIPFAAWVVAAWRVAHPDASTQLRAIDGASAFSRCAAALRHDAPALIRGWAIAGLAILTDGVSFDLAQVRTYGYELRTLDAVGGSPREVLALGWPGVAVVVAMLAIAALAPRRSNKIDRPLPVLAKLRWPALIAMVIALPPLMIVWRAASPHEASTFARLYTVATTNSLLLSLGAAVLLALAAMSLVSSWSCESRAARYTARLIAGMWIIAAAAPATLVAIALESAWNRASTSFVYDSAAIVVVGLVARFGAVAAIGASLAAAIEPSRTRWLRAVDAPTSWRWRWRLRRPTLVTAALVAGVVGTALAFSEVAVTARIRPPTIDVLASSTLNAIHYQQPETVLLGSAVAIVLGLTAAIVGVVLLMRRPRWVLALSLLVASCTSETGQDGSDATSPIPSLVEFGGPGFGRGQFHTPRAVAFDPTTRRFFIVDKESRVQRFDENGEFQLQWRMPESVSGRPVGISIHPDGRVFIADTHYYRVMVFDQDGNELARFGSFGKTPGHFIYVTDVAFGQDGRIYVGEFGSNDRIQIFSADFKYLGQFGSFGTNDGELSRPQSLVFDRARNELYVADSNNHRIVVYDPDGKILRQFGGPGLDPGRLSYPRGIVLVGDGTILVCEFGNHRVQHLDAREGDQFGACLKIWGGVGADSGRLQYPWDIAGVPGRIAVLDSGRDRVLIAPLPSAQP